jgi:hypothetical protein
MSNHEMPPQALLDPGLAIVTTGNLRGPILSILRAACAPVKISEIVERYHPEMAGRVRDTLADLAYFGLAHLSATHATALRGTGSPYKRVEVREVVEMARPVQEDRYTVPMPTHTPEPGKVRTAPVKVKKPKPTGPCVSSRETFRQTQREAGRKYRESIWPTIENLRNEGLSIRKIHMATNHSEQTITKIIKERVAAGWADPCGDKFVPVPITEHDRENARKMRMAGSSIRAICKFLSRDRKSVLRALMEVVR